jgi:hypothetical protein
MFYYAYQVQSQYTPTLAEIKGATQLIYMSIYIKYTNRNGLYNVVARNPEDPLWTGYGANMFA